MNMKIILLIMALVPFGLFAQGDISLQKEIESFKKVAKTLTLELLPAKSLGEPLLLKITPSDKSSKEIELNEYAFERASVCVSFEVGNRVGSCSFSMCDTGIKKPSFKKYSILDGGYALIPLDSITLAIFDIFDKKRFGKGGYITEKNIEKVRIKIQLPALTNNDWRSFFSTDELMLTPKEFLDKYEFLKIKYAGWDGSWENPNGTPNKPAEEIAE